MMSLCSNFGPKINNPFPPPPPPPATLPPLGTASEALRRSLVPYYLETLKCSHSGGSVSSETPPGRTSEGKKEEEEEEEEEGGKMKAKRRKNICYLYFITFVLYNTKQFYFLR